MKSTEEILNQEAIDCEVAEIEQPSSETVEEENESHNQFDEIKIHFPDIQSQDDLPKEVKDIAKEEKISYFDAYLRYLHFQEKRIESEKKNREQNNQNAVGSLKSDDTDLGLSYINAMLKAINK